MSLPASTSQSVSVYDPEPGEAEAAEAAAGALCCSEGEDEKLSSANVFKGGESGGVGVTPGLYPPSLCRIAEASPWRDS